MRNIVIEAGKIRGRNQRQERRVDDGALKHVGAD